MIIASLTASAQDVIVKKDGSTVLCKIVQVSPTEVVYLKWSDLSGPQYIMDSSLVANINYQDGRQDKLNEQTGNVYAPGNQQTGEAMYNDNALLALDNARNALIPKQVKTLKIIGWSVGGGLFVIGGICLGLSGFEAEYSEFLISGIVIAAAGVATTTGCLIRAHQLKKKTLSLTTASLIQKEFSIGERSSFSAGIDLIHDNQFKQNTLGLGLQFNF